VIRTLVLWNKTLVSGNFRAANGLGPDAIAYDSVQQDLYVADGRSASITVVDAWTSAVVGSIPVYPNPGALAYDPANGYLYVAYPGGNNLTVINATTNTITGSILLGGGFCDSPTCPIPVALAFDSANGDLYLVTGYDAVIVVNTTNGTTAARLEAGSGADAIAYDSGNGLLYVANGASDNLTVFNATEDAVVGNISVGADPRGVAYDSANQTIYVANVGSDDVSVIDSHSNNVTATVPVGTGPVALTYDGSLGYVWVADNGSDNVTVINATTNHVVASVLLSSSGQTGPVAILYVGGTQSVYVADAGFDTLSTISGLYAGGVASTILGVAPQAVAYDPVSGYLYVAYNDSENVSLVNLTTDQWVGSVPVGPRPDALQFADGSMFVANGGSNNVTVINGTTNRVAGSVTVGAGPCAFALDRVHHDLYVSGTGSANVTVIDTSTSTVATSIPVGAAHALAYDNATEELFAVNDSAQQVSIVNTTNDQFVGSFGIPSLWSWGEEVAVYNAVNGLLYVTGPTVPDVAVVKVTNGSESFVSLVPVGSQPDALAIDDHGSVYVANEGSGNLSIISGASNGVVGSVAVGEGPVAVGLANESKSPYVYVANHQSGSLSVVLPEQGYPVTFDQSGLPSVDSWSVALDDSRQTTGASSSITFVEPNGTFAFRIPGVPGYLPSPATGTVTVSGGPVVVSIRFMPPEFNVTFVEQGLPTGTLWFANVTGQTPQNSTGTAVTTWLPNGTYTFTLGSAAPGYFAPGGSFQVTGASVVLHVTFSSVRYSVSFTESGLPTGDAWYLNITGGPTLSSTSASVATPLPNGSYSYVVGSADRRYAAPAGLFAVHGANMTVPVVFHLVTYSLEFDELGLPAGALWFVNLTGQPSLSSTSSTITTELPNGTYTYKVATVHKELSAPGGSLTVAGAAVGIISVVFNWVRYAVTFTESGLGVGVQWFLNISGGFNLTSSTPSIGIDLINGTYSYWVGCAYRDYAAAGGLFTVNGTALNVSVTFHLVTYVVEFGESGLPSGTRWYVNITGAPSLSSQNTTITTALPNGTFEYSVATPAKQYAAPSNAFTVAGAALWVPVTFRLVVYAVTFIETGLSPGTLWSIVVAGVVQNTSGTTLVFPEANGTYSFTVPWVTGYSMSPVNGSVTVDANPVWEQITYSVRTFEVVFDAAGHPLDTAWSVTLNGTTRSSSDYAIAFTEPNGTYPFSITGITGYTVSPKSGTVTVAGENVQLALRFTVVTYGVTFAESGLPSGTSWGVSYSGSSDFLCTYYSDCAESTNNSSLSFHAFNGTWEFKVWDVPSNYFASPFDDVLTVAASNVSVPIRFTQMAPGALPFYVSELGLPLGTGWWVVLNGTRESTNGSALMFALASGPHAFTAGTSAPSNLLPFPAAGSITVYVRTWLNNASILFAAAYPVTFDETGLAAGSGWFLTVWVEPGFTLSYPLVLASTSDSVTANLPNGTYQIIPGYAIGYRLATNIGWVTVSGAGVSVSMAFVPFTYPVDFWRYGLPYEYNWAVSVVGLPCQPAWSCPGSSVSLNLSSATPGAGVPGAGVLLTASLPNGTYRLSATVLGEGDAQNYYPSYPNGTTFVVDGSTTPGIYQNAVRFSEATYPVTFQVSGFQFKGSDWVLSLWVHTWACSWYTEKCVSSWSNRSAAAEGSVNASSVFYFANTTLSDTVVWAVAAGPGEVATPGSGSLWIDGTDPGWSVTVSINFGPRLLGYLPLLSEYKGEFLAGIPLWDGVYLLSHTTYGNATAVSGSVDGTPVYFRNTTRTEPMGPFVPLPNGKWEAYVNTSTLNPGAVLQVNATYADGGYALASYPFTIVQAPPWVASIEAMGHTYVQNTCWLLHCQPWNNTYFATTYVDMEAFRSNFCFNVDLPSWAGGGEYCLLPDFNLTFVFDYDGTVHLSGQFQSQSMQVTVASLAFGLQASVSATGSISTSGGTVVWGSGSLTLDLSGSVSETVPIAGYDFPLIGRVGLSATVGVGASYAATLILNPTTDPAHGIEPGLLLAVTNVVSVMAISVSVYLDLSIGFGTGLSGGGSLTVKLAWESSPAGVVGIQVLGSASVVLSVLGASTTIASTGSGVIYNWGTMPATPALADPETSDLAAGPSPPAYPNWSITPRYYNTTNYDRVDWTPGAESGVAVEDVYPTPSVSLSGGDSGALALYTSDNVSRPQPDGLSLEALAFNSSSRSLGRVVIPVPNGELAADPRAVSLSNGSYAVVWNAVPFTEMNASNPLSIHRSVLQLAYYAPTTATWSKVTNVTDSGFSQSYSLDASSGAVRILDLVGSSPMGGLQHLVELRPNGTVLEEVAVYDAAQISSWRAATNLAVVRLASGSFTLVNLTSSSLLSVDWGLGGDPSEVSFVQGSSDLLQALFPGATASTLEVFNVTNWSVDGRYALPSNASDAAVVLHRGELFAPIAEPAGISMYLLTGTSADLLATRAVSNVTSISVAASGSDLVVVGEASYGTLDHPLVNLTLAEFPLATQKVTVTESGLPNGSAWSLKVSGGSSFSSNATNITFQALNGTYNFTASALNTSYGSPAGSFSVNGTPVAVPVVFRAVLAAPEATVNPVDEGQATTLSALASGGSDSYPKYTWTGLPPGCGPPGNVPTFTCTPAVGAASPWPYTVVLAVTDSNGAQVTEIIYLTVDPALGAGTLSATPSPVDVGQSTTIATAGASGGSGTGTYQYAWTGLPEGCSGTTASFSCTPGAGTAGTYSLNLTVTDGNGNTATTAFTLTVNGALTVSASASPNAVDVGQATTLSAGTSGGSGTYLSYVWSGSAPPGCTLPGGTTTSSFGCTPGNGSQGSYTITVQVTDSNGNTVSNSFTLTVNPVLSAGAASASHDPVDVGQATTLATSGASGGGGGYTYAWSGLPDGCNSTATSFSCTPTSSSESPYTVTLTVTDANGITATASFNLTVDSALSAGTVSATHNPVDVGQATTVSAVPSGGSGTYPSYVWSGSVPLGCTLPSGSGPGTFSCTPGAGSQATYVVTVTVMDSNGNVVAGSFTLTVDRALSAGAVTATTNPVDTGRATTISTSGAEGGSGTGTYEYAWTGLPAGCAGTTASFGCTPSVAGTYAVKLTVTDANGYAATGRFALTVLAQVSFAETGLPSGTTWSVNVTDEPPTSSSTSTLEVSVPNGTYAFTVALVLEHWAPTPGSSSVLVSGSATSVSVTFTFTYAVTFLEPQGTPSGSSWSVTLSGAETLPLIFIPAGTVTRATTGSTIELYEPNGTYSYWVLIGGQSTYNGTGTVRVQGGSVTVTPAALSGPSTFPYLLYGAIGGGVAVVIVGLVLFLRRRKPLPTGTPSGGVDPGGAGGATEASSATQVPTHGGSPP